MSEVMNIESQFADDPAYLRLSRPAKLTLAELCRQTRFLPNGLLVINQTFVKSIGECPEQLWWIEDELANALFAMLTGWSDDFAEYESVHFFRVAWLPCSVRRFPNLDTTLTEGDE
ncbi:hypothetical protein [Paraburkholderia sp. MM5384-R2]|uniref:hypothetical protein n=1 Tax=Paraburkholderia sp. MM5384-R2 TaxID=2723097 RepID=UPI001612FEF2|nr:hypothetical protein [Paraburkholderia sp. MM5384-R2]MBB5501555.1 hypothetical protein [Paraburkholderia sp. MM5384-R2]